jgi:hypothetical protein
MNFSSSIKQPLLKENEKGIILLAAVIVLIGIILVLIVGSYLSINALRKEIFLLPKIAQSFANAESCLAIAISKLKTSPAYTTQENWKEFKEEDILCQYLIEEKEGIKIIKIKGLFSNYFQKIIAELKIVEE